MEYTILEQPVKGEPETVGPEQEKPKRENPAQLNTNKSNTDLSSTEGSNPIPLNSLGPQTADGDGTDGMMANRETYKQLVKENIEYAYPIQDMSLDRECIDKLVEQLVVVDTVCFILVPL